MISLSARAVSSNFPTAPPSRRRGYLDVAVEDRTTTDPEARDEVISALEDDAF